MESMKHDTTRTTITLDAALLRDIKQRAAAEGITISKFVEDLLRMQNLRSQEPRKKVELPTFKSGGLRPGVDINSNAALQEILDEGLPLEKLR